MSLRRSAPMHTAGSVHIVPPPVDSSTSTSIVLNASTTSTTTTTTASRASSSNTNTNNSSNSALPMLSSSSGSVSASSASSASTQSSSLLYSGDRTRVLVADGVAVKTLQFRTATACNVTRDVVSLLLTLRRTTLHTHTLSL
jgi:hypothetical protein